MRAYNRKNKAKHTHKNRENTSYSIDRLQKSSKKFSESLKKMCEIKISFDFLSKNNGGGYESSVTKNTKKL